MQFKRGRTAVISSARMKRNKQISDGTLVSTLSFFTNCVEVASAESNESARANDAGNAFALDRDTSPFRRSHSRGA